VQSSKSWSDGMGTPKNLDLFGAEPLPWVDGRDRKKRTQTEFETRKLAYQARRVQGVIVDPVCGACSAKLVITTNYYYMCRNGHTKLIDPRDFIED